MFDWSSFAQLLINSFFFLFVFYYRRAILSNEDVNSKNAFSNLWQNDFWGTPLASTNSHGSYRPLCVLTFRLNYWLFGYRPWGYHLTNVILHTITTGLVLKLGKILLPQNAARFGSLLFAVHPVHTEAVAGIVGRADVISCIFFILTVLCYIRHREEESIETIGDLRHHSCKLKRSSNHVDWTWDSSRVKSDFWGGVDKFKCNLGAANFVKSNVYLALTVCCGCLAMLCKETGFTALPVCLLYEILLLHRSQFGRGKKVRKIFKFLMFVKPNLICLLSDH